MFLVFVSFQSFFSGYQFNTLQFFYRWQFCLSNLGLLFFIALNFIESILYAKFCPHNIKFSGFFFIKILLIGEKSWIDWIWKILFFHNLSLYAFFEMHLKMHLKLREQNICGRNFHKTPYFSELIYLLNLFLQIWPTLICENFFCSVVLRFFWVHYIETFIFDWRLS